MRARIKVDVRTKPGDHITLSNVDMTVLQAYGHTPGAVSFSFRVTDAGELRAAEQDACCDSQDPG